MKTTIKGSLCTVSATRKGERYRNESALFYALRNLFRKSGKDVIKRCPGKDGHLTASPYYIRERKGRWCVWDGDYAIRNSAEDFNRNGVVTLHYVR